MTTKLYPYQFKDSGIEIMIRKVSPLLIIDMQKEYPAPQPPLQEVKIGDLTRMEPNPDHPDYKRAMEAWNMENEERLRKLMVRQGVAFTLSEEQKQDVEALRETYRELYQKEIPYNDRDAYLFYVAIASPRDLQDLINAIMSQNPTEESVQAAQDSFPGAV